MAGKLRQQVRNGRVLMQCTQGTKLQATTFHILLRWSLCGIQCCGPADPYLAILASRQIPHLKIVRLPTTTLYPLLPHLYRSLLYALRIGGCHYLSFAV